MSEAEWDKVKKPDRLKPRRPTAGHRLIFVVLGGELQSKHASLQERTSHVQRQSRRRGVPDDFFRRRFSSHGKQHGVFRLKSSR